MQYDRMNKQVNYALKNVVFELTRRCNLSCGHCLKGDAQNVDMSDEVMDAFFGKVGAICHLSLGSGEIGLVPERIEKLTEMLNKHQTFVKQVYLYTNATAVSDRFIDALKSLEQYVININKYHTACDILREDHFPVMPPMLIDISLDKYHVKELESIGITPNKFKENVSKIAHAFPGKVQYCDMAHRLYNEGRATDISFLKAYKLRNRDFRLGAMLTTNDTRVCDETPYIDENGETFTRNVIHLGPNMILTYDGKLSDSQRSYNNQDEIAKGNILTDSILEMAKEHDIYYAEQNNIKQGAKLFEKIANYHTKNPTPTALHIPIIAAAKISSSITTAPYHEHLEKRERCIKKVPPVYPEQPPFTEECEHPQQQDSERTQ